MPISDFLNLSLWSVFIILWHILLTAEAYLHVRLIPIIIYSIYWLIICIYKSYWPLYTELNPKLTELIYFFWNIIRRLPLIITLQAIIFFFSTNAILFSLIALFLLSGLVHVKLKIIIVTLNMFIIVLNYCK